MSYDNGKLRCEIGVLTRRRPTHILYELLPGEPLVVQPLLFFLPIFLAAGAFKNMVLLLAIWG